MGNHSLGEWHRLSLAGMQNLPKPTENLKGLAEASPFIRQYPSAS